MVSKTHVPLSGSKRGRDLTAFEVGKVNPKEEIIITIGLRGQKELPGPDEFDGPTLKPKQFADEFGGSEADVDQVRKSLENFRLKVKEVSVDRRRMRVSGTAKAMEAAFKPKWAMMHSSCQGVYRGRRGTIHIPAELKGIVTGVFGLDQRRMAFRRSGAAVPADKITAPSPWKPEDIEKNYNFPPGGGEGQSIAIAQFGGGYCEDDLSAYCRELGRPTPKVQLIPVRAPAHTLQDILALQNPDLRKAKLEESFEVMMDLEIIAGLCPEASISVYFSTFNQMGWIDLLEKVIAADPPPVALSISWGRAEDDESWTVSAIEEINYLLNRASRLGITTCVASGDDGWKTGILDDNFGHVDFPSSSPFVMAVGGTMLSQFGDEVAWNEGPVTDVDGNQHGGGATGGGVSGYFGRPAWQKNVNVKPLNKKKFKGRVIPDVSVLAGEPYYYLRFLDMDWPEGHTSASAPVWAALIARINANLPSDKRQRFLTPLLYKKLPNGKTVGEAAFRDIKIGDNAVYHHHPGNGYKAGPGFDAVTGWGVPIGEELRKCLEVI
jgi:kumamolisin